MAEQELPYTVPKGWGKSITLDVLAFRDSDSSPDQIVRSWFKTTIIYTVFSEEPYAHDYLSILKTNRLNAGFQMRAFHHHFVDTERGFSTFEMGFEDRQIDGITVKTGKIVPITNDEAVTLVKQHAYKILRFEGNRLTLPYVYNETRS